MGPVPNRPDRIRKLVEKLASAGAQLRFCYEAGLCGYGLHRQLVATGHDCSVIAPALIPATARDRQGAPAAAGFLLRHSWICPGKTGRTGACRRWRALVRFTHPAQQIVLQDDIDAVADAEVRVERLTGQIADLPPHRKLAPEVAAIQAMPGAGFIVAVTVVAEAGDFQHFDSPPQLMAYPGLTPSEHSSAASLRRGGIDKAGSGRAGCALIERARSYRMQARITVRLLARLQVLPKLVRDICWKGPLRTCQSCRHLMAGGKARW